MELLNLALVGIVVSAIVQIIKKYFGWNSWKAISVAVGLSLLAALFYEVTTMTGYWESFVKILLTANSVYLYILKHTNEKTTPS